MLNRKAFGASRVNQENTTRSITVYPNPVVSDIRVIVCNAWQNELLNIQVINAHGQSVIQLTNTRPGQTETINVNDLTPGMYIVQVSNGKETAMQRFVKMR